MQIRTNPKVIHIANFGRIEKRLLRTVLEECDSIHLQEYMNNNKKHPIYFMCHLPIVNVTN